MASNSIESPQSGSPTGIGRGAGGSPQPPPPPGGLPTAAGAGRGELLSSIENGASLRESTEVNDRSAPAITKVTSELAAPPTVVVDAVSANLPAEFLRGPAPNPKKTVIDFGKTALPEYKGMYAVVIDGVLSPEECEQLTSAAEQRTGGEWERAMINMGQGRQAMYEDVRKCGRIIWDDRDMVARIWARCEPLVPELGKIVNQPHVSGSGPTKRGEVWRMTRCNERMRILKYKSGEYFKPHCDGTFETPDGTERSYYTLHLYLNDTDHQPEGEDRLEGGATTYWSMNEERRFDVAPKMGSVLLFQHRFLVHAGDDVIRGMKITLRTDLMYELSDEIAPPYVPPQEPRWTLNKPKWLSSVLR